MIGILGKKIGMSQVYDAKGKLTPVTLIEVEPSLITAVRTLQDNGYRAYQLAIGSTKKKSKNKPLKRFIRELRLSEKDKMEKKKGDFIDATIFNEGDFVDIQGVSKGKGFQGGVKRWGWKGGVASHGSMFHRRVGSIGASSYPSRVHKGKTMPGHMGSAKVTTQNLRVIKIDKEKQLLIVKGAVAGHSNSYVIVKESKKKPKKVEQKNDTKK